MREHNTELIIDTLVAMFYSMLEHAVIQNEYTFKHAVYAFFETAHTMHYFSRFYCSKRDIKKQLVERINEKMITDYFLDMYIDYDDETDDYTIKHIFHIAEQYRKATKAKYNLNAYINQYIDFYSNI